MTQIAADTAKAQRGLTEFLNRLNEQSAHEKQTAHATEGEDCDEIEK